MLPDWVFSVLWLIAGVIGGGAVWYFLSQGRPLTAVWVGFAFAVIVLLGIALSIRNSLLRKEAVGRSLPATVVDQRVPGPRTTGRLDLARGWTLHRKSETLTVYFMIDTNQMDDAVRGEFQQGDVRLDEIASELLEEAQGLWAEVKGHVPRPEPPRTMIGPIVADLIEHLNHTLSAPQGSLEDRLAWNYEYLRSGTAIKQVTPVGIPVAALSAAGQATVEKLDLLAVETVNRRYIEAVQRVTKPPHGP